MVRKVVVILATMAERFIAIMGVFEVDKADNMD